MRRRRLVALEIGSRLCRNAPWDCFRGRTIFLPVFSATFATSSVNPSGNRGWKEGSEGERYKWPSATELRQQQQQTIIIIRSKQHPCTCVVFTDQLIFLTFLARICSIFSLSPTSQSATCPEKDILDLLMTFSFRFSYPIFWMCS